MGNYDVPMFFIGLWFTYLILLKRPERDFERHDENQPPGPTDSREFLRWQRGRATSVLFSPRLHHWFIGEDYHDDTQPPARYYANELQYLLHWAWQLPLSYLALDTMYHYFVIQDPYWINLEMYWWEPYDADALRRTIVVWVSCWAITSLLECLISPLFLFLHLAGILGRTWSPHMHPPAFGSPMQILSRGVRGFWARGGF
ncbi:uncharacterized protein RHO25_009313 [Cercospora beticola]|uniref:Wax synthase domain-containing protein n=1 Tax=Cercospora beticola TaxID=122368 RepID=A0ABZ0NYY0_CERBT|nr:hypothetical protein RHO25_009313 [Cercospora beticola]